MPRLSKLPEHKTTSIRVPLDLLEAIDERARNEGIARNDLILRYLTLGLGTEGKQERTNEDLSRRVRVLEAKLQRAEEKYQLIDKIASELDSK